MKRQHILLVGMLLLLLGMQFRMVESVTLSERSSQLVAGSPATRTSPQLAWQNATNRKVVEPPRWLGLALMSVGSVLALRSLKPPKFAAAR
jgi:hypothetical protein